MVQSLTIAFLPQCMALIGALLMQEAEGEVSFISGLMNGVVACFVIVYPVCCLVYLLVYKDDFESQEQRKKIGALIQDVNYKKNYWSLVFYPVFLWRRILFALIPFVLSLRTGCQLIALVLTTQAYLHLIVEKVHFNNKAVKRLIMFNEVMFVIMVYFQLIFSHLTAMTSHRFLMMKFEMGYLYLGTIGFMVAVNISYLAYNIVVYLIWLKRMRSLALERNQKYALLKAQVI